MSSRISSRLFSSLRSLVFSMNVLDPKVPLWKRSARPTWHGTPPLRAERGVKSEPQTPRRVQRSNVAENGAWGCMALDRRRRWRVEESDKSKEKKAREPGSFNFSLFSRLQNG